MTSFNFEPHKLFRTWAEVALILRGGLSRDFTFIVDNGTISGGYVRDSILGLPPKDIDFYVPYPGNGAYNKLYGYLDSEFGVEDKNIPNQLDDTVEDYIRDVCGVKVVKKVIELKNFHIKDLPVQIVFHLLYPKVAHGYFDFGICQCSYNKNTGLILSPNFLQDIENETATLFLDNVKGSEGKARSRKRFDRWVAKGLDFEYTEYSHDLGYMI